MISYQVDTWSTGHSSPSIYAYIYRPSTQQFKSILVSDNGNKLLLNVDNRIVTLAVKVLPNLESYKDHMGRVFQAFIQHTYLQIASLYDQMSLNIAALRTYYEAEDPFWRFIAKLNDDKPKPYSPAIKTIAKHTTKTLRNWFAQRALYYVLGWYVEHRIATRIQEELLFTFIADPENFDQERSTGGCKRFALSFAEYRSY